LRFVFIKYANQEELLEASILHEFDGLTYNGKVNRKANGEGGMIKEGEFKKGQ